MANLRVYVEAIIWHEYLVPKCIMDRINLSKGIPNHLNKRLYYGTSAKLKPMIITLELELTFCLHSWIDRDERGLQRVAK